MRAVGRNGDVRVGRAMKKGQGGRETSGTDSDSMRRALAALTGELADLFALAVAALLAAFAFLSAATAASSLGRAVCACGRVHGSCQRLLLSRWRRRGRVR